MFRSGIVCADADEALDEQHVRPLVVDIALHTHGCQVHCPPGLTRRQLTPHFGSQRRIDLAGNPVALDHQPGVELRGTSRIDASQQLGRAIEVEPPGAQLVEVETYVAGQCGHDGVTGERLCTAQRAAESRQAPPQGTERVYGGRNSSALNSRRDSGRSVIRIRASSAQDW